MAYGHEPEGLLADYDEPSPGMRLEFHGEELAERFPFARVPDGDYKVRTTAYPDNGESFDFLWPVTLKNGTLTAHEVTEDNLERSPELQGVTIR